MKNNPRQTPHSWPGDIEPDFDEDEDDQGLDDLPGIEPRQPRRTRQNKKRAQNPGHP
jgi:hypothetical protein